MAAKRKEEGFVQVRIKISPAARDALRAMAPSERKQGEFLTRLLVASYERYQTIQQDVSADPVEAVLVESFKSKQIGGKR